ncbi:Murein DD-endopeptidase MepM and murein hydrolase activator NlpD, contain LysM domain [Beijerinckia sp. 28-YEA-48]|nr:Murein DD-endopeptidase MepM and murein hydrolase activator NlpD, contain LysM domain [Beijerinckia sp. 28-YEA-48]
MRMPMRFALMSATALLIAGCSDSSRLADLTGGVDRSATGSVPRPPDPVNGGYPVAQAASAPVRSASIQSSPLPPPTIPSRPNYTAPATPSPQLSAAPAAHVATTATAGVRSSGPWTASGGTAITAGQGDTASALSNRYGVPQEALLKVNGLSSASQIQPGTRVVIPIYNLSAQSSSAPAAAAAKPEHKPVMAAKPEHTPAKVAEAAKPAPTAKPKLAEVKKPEPARKPEKVAEKPAEAVKAAKLEAARPTKVDATPTASVPPAQEAKPTTTASVSSDDGKPEFRWPARGRVIQGFKAGGNDGINIAVPEGTAVKAAEGGVVAYAGSELKGYGNLVLIRHPNGFVSAYAHNGQLSVKRGEAVKRGQTIATSGQSGNVSSPQLHFELRKGSTPVDPSGYLAGL